MSIYISQLNFSTHFFTPTIGTPDYFNSCCTIPNSVSTPNNAFGYQNAKSYSAYGGFYTYGNVLMGQSGYEYISDSLIIPLDSGKIYCVSFFISLANKSRYATSSFGVLFSQNIIFQNNTYYLPFTPQINFDTVQAIRDTSSWIKISGRFMSSGGEKYITIGNFRDNQTDPILLVDTISSSPNSIDAAYYYIDDITVIECSDVEFYAPNVFTPNGDGLNDLFEIKGLQKGDKINIYNRWGTKVFYNVNEHAYWDGYTTSGEPCSSGTYFYTIDLINGERKSGYIQLIR